MNKRQRKKVETREKKYTEWFGEWMGLQIDCSIRRIKGIPLPPNVRTFRFAGLEAWDSLENEGGA